MFSLKKSTLISVVVSCCFLLSSFSLSFASTTRCKNIFLSQRPQSVSDLDFFIHSKSWLKINAYVPSNMYFFSDPYRLESKLDLKSFIKFYSFTDTVSLKKVFQPPLLSFSLDFSQAGKDYHLELEEFTPLAKVLYENRKNTSIEEASYFYLSPYKRIFMIRVKSSDDKQGSYKDFFVETQEVKYQGKKVLLIEDIQGASAFYQNMIIDILSDKKDFFGVKLVAHLAQNNLSDSMVYDSTEERLESESVLYSYSEPELMDALTEEHVEDSLPIYVETSKTMRLVKSSVPEKILGIFSRSSTPRYPQIKSREAKIRPYFLYNLASSSQGPVTKTIKYNLLIKYIKSYMQTQPAKDIKKPTGWLFELLALPFLDPSSGDKEFCELVDLIFNRNRLSILEYEKLISKKFDIDIQLDQVLTRYAKDFEQSFGSSKIYLSDFVPLEALIRMSDITNENLIKSLIQYALQKVGEHFVLDDSLDIILDRSDLKEVTKGFKAVLIDERTQRYILIDEKGNLEPLQKISQNVFLWKENGKYGLIDSLANILLVPQYKSVTIMGDFIKVTTDSGFSGLMDQNGCMLLGTFYEEVKPINRRLVRVKRNNLYGIVSSTEGIILPVEFSHVDTDSQDTAENSSVIVLKRDFLGRLIAYDFNIVTKKIKKI